MRIACSGLLLALAMAAPGAGAQEAPTEPDAVVLQPVLVKGSQPGPGMWRVTSGEHTLWILGTLSPLPVGMKWRSGEVEATIAKSQEILGVPMGTPKFGVGTMFKMVSLAPSAMRTQRNPDGATLKEVLGDPLYARWALARDKYLAHEKDLETLRPLVASQQLYWKAVEYEGLDRRDVVGPVVKQASKRSGVPITETGFEFPLELDRKDVKRRIKEINGKSADDLPCFTKTLEVLQPEVLAMKQRANAWAVGDVAALRELSTSDFKPPCQKLVEDAVAFLGIAEIRKRLRDRWLSAAQHSLAKNQNTFATLPISELLDPDGMLGELQRRGYVVEAPDDAPPEEALDEP